MNSTVPIITRCGRKYRPASSGGRTLNDLNDEVDALALEYIEEEEQVLRLRVLRARVAALSLPQPSRLLSAIDTLLASHYDEMGDLKTRRELEYLIHIALREKVKARRAGPAHRRWRHWQPLSITADWSWRISPYGLGHHLP